MLVASLAVGLTVATALVADLGRLYLKRTRMQVATDAAALAGAQGLRASKAEALHDAQALALANGFQLASGGVSFPTDRRCRVEIRGAEPLLLGKLLQIGNLDVAAASTAELHSQSQRSGPRPFGVPDTDFVLGHCVNPGREYVLKTGAGARLQGNFLPLALDGPGDDEYVDAILAGAKRSVSVGDIVDAKPGDMPPATATAICKLVGDDQTPYDEAAAHPQETPRIIDVPMISPHALKLGGRTMLRVTGIGHFYITYAERGRIYGRFIGGATDKTIAGSAGRDAVKLVE